MTKQCPAVAASFDAAAGWRLFVGERDVSGFIPEQKRSAPMQTRKCYPDGFSGYTYSDWIRKNKWVKAFADGKPVRLAIYAAIRQSDWK